MMPHLRLGYDGAALGAGPQLGVLPGGQHHRLHAEVVVGDVQAGREGILILVLQVQAHLRGA